jgi:hypothetical protein
VSGVVYFPRSFDARMKTPRFILIGLVTLVSVLAVWLQFGTNQEPSPPHAGSSPVLSPAERLAVEKQEEDRGAASRPPDEAAHVAPQAASPTGDAASLPFGFERQQLLERSGFDAAALGADAALQKLAGIVGAADRVAFLRGMFARLASGTPADNVRAIHSLPEGIERETALAALVAGLRSTPQSPAQQARLIENFGSIGGILAGLLGNPAMAAEYASQLLTGMDKARLLSSAAAIEAAKDPQRALSFGVGLEGKERREFMIGLASGWGRSAGEAAWAWSLQETDADLRDALQAAIVEGWTQTDPKSAAQYAAQIGSAEAREKAIKTLGSEWASVDTQAAMAWANSLSNPQERTIAAEAISSTAPVGIGVALGMGPEGYPVIRELIAGGPASTVGTLKDGYQIAAISDGAGRFTDLRGKDLGDIVSMMRGKPGSNVWLQVVQPGGNPTDRTTIMITRQQLMFKRPPGA